MTMWVRDSPGAAPHLGRGRHLALLRAVNVPGHARITAQALRDAFAAAGCRHVRTFGHGGNVIFESPVRSEASLRTRLTAGFRARVALLSHRPRGRARLPSENPEEALVAIGLRKRVPFLVSLPKARGFYGIRNPFIERALGVTATCRNWSTATRLPGLAATPARRDRCTP
jgi:hypothetical protein